MKNVFINIFAVLALVFSGAALADDHGDMEKGAKGKEKAAKMKSKADDMKGKEEAEDEQAEEAKEKAEEEAEEKAEEAEEKAEDENEKAEDGEGKPMKQKGDKPKGLEKKESAPQAGKGSEKGQQMREEKSQSWWKFWD